MSKFETQLAKIMGVEKVTGLDKFSLLTGTIGLVVDTAAIIGFAGGLVLPNLPTPKGPPQGGLILTAFLGLYSLTLIMWFLIRFERVKRERLGLIDADASERTIDILNGQMDGAVAVLLIPILGTIYMYFIAYETMIISFLSVFISWLPATLWIYTLTANPWSGIGFGLLVSIFLTQYSIWFALILDKFFH